MNRQKFMRYMRFKRIKGTLTKEEIVVVYQKGKTARDIAKTDGTSYQSILSVLHRLGAKMRVGHRRALEAKAKAAEFGCAQQTYLRYKAIAFWGLLALFAAWLILGFCI